MTELDNAQAIRRQVLGDAHVDRAAANADAFSAPFQAFITEHAWGAVWTRDGLSLKERSITTLAVLVALRATDELKIHVRGALNNGLTPDEIRELIMHAGIYAGIPSANHAFKVAQEVLADVQAE